VPWHIRRRLVSVSVSVFVMSATSRRSIVAKSGRFIMSMTPRQEDSTEVFFGTSSLSMCTDTQEVVLYRPLFVVCKSSSE
jgi:hypothetical protein